MRKERNKLKPADIEKIRARFKMKYEEFIKLPLYDEFEEDGTTLITTGLRTLFREGKMSSTDREALVAVVDTKMRQQQDEFRKKLEEEQASKVEVPDTKDGAE